MKPATLKPISVDTLRTLRGPYSKREVAEAIGALPESYSEWEAGKSQPNPENFRALLDHYRTWMKHYDQDPTRIVNSLMQLLFTTEDNDQEPKQPQTEATQCKPKNRR